jgi:hypothetical protein
MGIVSTDVANNLAAVVRTAVLYQDNLIAIGELRYCLSNLLN